MHDFVVSLCSDKIGMRQSQLFAKTVKTFPEGEETANAKLLTKAGFIAKSSPGVYSFLPLGLRVMGKINAIIREEMNAIGGEELLMPSLIERKYWEKSERWGSEVIYKTGKAKRNQPASGDAHDFEYGLGWTHEEVIAAIATNFIQSYRDLPKAVYQIQTKFRAEVRAQGGLLRGREFLMKDLYSFHRDAEDLNRYYKIVAQAYHTIFNRLSLRTLVVEAAGGAFTKEYTHEFQMLHEAGEDTVYYCEACTFAMNKEVFDASRHTKCKGEIKTARGIEVGNIFRLGTKFAEAFGLFYRDEKGSQHPVTMGSYGIGPSRLMGTLVEVHHDREGMVWPEAVAPFQVHLIEIKNKKEKSKAVETRAQEVYKALQKAGVEVLYDDREAVSAGEKFTDADLIGISYRAVVSEKTGDTIELKKRSESEAKLVTVKALIKLLSH